MRSFDVFFDLRLNKPLSKRNRETVELRRHRAHYDIIVMQSLSRFRKVCDTREGQAYTQVTKFRSVEANLQKLRRELFNSWIKLIRIVKSIFKIATIVIFHIATRSPRDQ